MTTLVLQTAGSVIGTAVGGPVGGMIGRAVGGMAGSVIDRAIFGGGTTRRIEGPRLQDMPGVGSTEGAPIPRVFGRARIGGELVWATRFEETVTETRRKTRSGGKGGGGGPKTVTRSYAYSGNFAIGLCEGPIAFVRRIWADGKPLDQEGLTIRVHRGTEDQEPDPLIAAKEGAEVTPAFRGTAYVVFERFPLGDYGNRIPQFAFEVVRPVGGLGERIRAIDLIPGAGEFVYEPAHVSRDLGSGNSATENRHELSAPSDWQASLDALGALCPNLVHVALVVSWFGDDLRVGECRILPKTDRRDKATIGAEWAAAGLDRGTAETVSLVDGKPAYGGTPSDVSVIRAIRDLKARGFRVTLYPFCMMDVPADSALPDPWTGATSQPAYPWRGRITCSPAPGRPGSPSGTAAAGAAVARFFGTVGPADMREEGGRILCAKPDEWSWRRLAMHCAALARAAGGVDALVIGTELVSLTRIASAPGVFPAAAHLAGIARDVRSMLPGTRITYAADWTEYGGHSPAPGELRFPLDPLWASDAIDAVSLDVYWPVSDLRDGPPDLDGGEEAGAADVARFARGVAGGEGFDWFYADGAARAAQRRTPITDGAYGKPWVWRVKDLVGWWSAPHHERVGGVEVAAPTAWRPKSKPIWFTELGCPAVDKGPNGPNVFPDPKSSEGATPPFSQGHRDDLVQQRMIEAVLDHFEDPARNPISPVYGGRMVDAERIYLWTWDARPFPAFPAQSAVWSDAANWRTGHWLTGRLEGMPLDRLVRALLADGEGPEASEIAIDGFVDGCVIDRPMTLRAVLEPLAEAFAFDGIVSGGTLRFARRGRGPLLRIGPDDLVPGPKGEPIAFRRAQETELPRDVHVAFIDGEWDYRRGSVMSRRLGSGSRDGERTDVPVVTTRSEAQRIADVRLHEIWAGRESAEFRLRPGLIGLEIGDVVELPVGTEHRPFRITRITDRGERLVEAVSTEPSVHKAPPGPVPDRTLSSPAVPGRPWAEVIDLPVATGSPPTLQALAVHADPWPGGFVARRSVDGESFTAAVDIDLPAIMGRTLSDFGPGPLWRWDDAAVLEVEFAGGPPAAGGELSALAAETPVAIKGEDGLWEVVAFARADLVGPRRFRLSRLIRGLGGSEALASRRVGRGAPVVLLDGAVTALTSDAGAIGSVRSWRVSAAGRDHGDRIATAEFEAAVRDPALRPLAPVHPKATRTAEGILIEWIRRSRIGGDGWEGEEIPLGETAEMHSLELLAGGSVIRRFRTTTPRLLYPQASESADFGVRLSELTLRIAQISPEIGPGAALDAVVPIL